VETPLKILPAHEHSLPPLQVSRLGDGNLSRRVDPEISQHNELGTRNGKPPVNAPYRLEPRNNSPLLSFNYSHERQLAKQVLVSFLKNESSLAIASLGERHQ